MIKRAFMMGLVAAAGMNSCLALPTLQLDIPGGTYNAVDETTYANSPQFNLRALYGGSSLSTTFYISAAITPGLGLSTLPPNIGSFTIGGVTYTGSSLTWGSPPINVTDNTSGTGPGNLAPHSIFPTYYAEIAFHFDTSHTVGAYNTADGTTSPGSLFYHDFAVDVSGLAAGLAIHFDLYDENLKSGNWTVDDFAPFSHDAQSGGVPDGGTTLALLGFAVVGTELFRRKVCKG